MLQPSALDCHTVADETVLTENVPQAGNLGGISPAFVSFSREIVDVPVQATGATLNTTQFVLLVIHLQATLARDWRQILWQQWSQSIGAETLLLACGNQIPHQLGNTVPKVFLWSIAFHFFDYESHNDRPSYKVKPEHCQKKADSPVQRCHSRELCQVWRTGDRAIPTALHSLPTEETCGILCMYIWWSSGRNC